MFEDKSAFTSRETGTATTGAARGTVVVVVLAGTTVVDAPAVELVLAGARTGGVVDEAAADVDGKVVVDCVGLAELEAESAPWGNETAAAPRAELPTTPSLPDPPTASDDRARVLAATMGPSASTKTDRVSPAR